MEDEVFTPGPWKVQSHKKNRICGPEGIIVAEAWYPPARAKRDAKQRAYAIGLANARLISAGPDGLEFARNALASGLLDDVLSDAARAFIAKVEGGAS